MGYSTMLEKQIEVTSCLILTLAALVLMLYQVKTFLSQSSDQQTIYDIEPQNSCNLRSKFIYSGGFSGIFLIVAGPLLLMVIYDMAKRYYQLGRFRAGTPFTLFIEGTAGGFALLSGIVKLFVMFKTKDKRRDRREPVNDHPHQTVPLVDIHGQHVPAIAKHGPSTDLFDCPGDYYGHDYDAANPRYHTQGHKYTAQDLFPGYKLGKQNLQGHDKTWWRKVTCASSPLR